MPVVRAQPLMLPYCNVGFVRFNANSVVELRLFTITLPPLKKSRMRLVDAKPDGPRAKPLVDKIRRS